MKRHLNYIWLATGVLMLFSLSTGRNTVIAAACVAFVIVSVLALLSSAWIKRRGLLLGPDEFLCDTCKFDYDGACRLPDRPNARRCSKYERSGG